MVDGYLNIAVKCLGQGKDNYAIGVLRVTAAYGGGRGEVLTPAGGNEGDGAPQHNSKASIAALYGRL